MKLVVSSAEKKQTKFRYESLAIVAADFLDAQTALSKLRKIYFTNSAPLHGTKNSSIWNEQRIYWLFNE